MVNRSNNSTIHPVMQSDEKQNQMLAPKRYEHKDIRRKFDDDIEIAQEFNPLFRMGEATGLFAGLKTKAFVEEGEKKLLNEYQTKRR